ncbi:Periplasmic thiol:disulfide interchange protein DsbA, partial [hydrothermal vent metagenome]
MQSSTKKSWWLILIILLFATACGAATPAAENEQTSGDQSITPQESNPFNNGLSVNSEAETAVSSSNAVPFIDGVVEYDADGIEVGFTEDGRAYRGNPNAPIVIEEFSDFQCPFCGRFAEQTFPSLNANQIANGEVMFIYYDFPLNIHDQAGAAANAARCAGEQSAVAYWQMHDLLFEDITEWTHNRANAIFSSYGEELGLEMDRFNSCLETYKYGEAIQADYELGLSRGVSSTPSFYINDQPLIGAQPLETFNQTIALIREGGSIAAAPSEAISAEAYAVPTPAAIPMDADNVAWSAGDPNAPVQIVEFTDYQCPFCQQYATETFPTLYTEMIESGRVYYVIKDLPLESLHPEAVAAATAVRCAGEQDAYKALHDVLFANQDAWSGSGETAAIDSLVELAGSIGLDTEALARCISLGEQRNRVLANQQEAFALGVNSTPAFYVNGYPLRGAQPFDVFESVIELAENGELEAVLEAQVQRAYEQAQAQAAQAQAPQPPSGPVDISTEDAYAIGDPNAPITIIEYTDFQCPFCSRHSEQTFPLLKENYIDTGVVRYVFKDFPLTQIHPQAVLAANAARCAGDQDAFLAMHDALFANQAQWNNQNNAEEFFNQYANEIGLDGDQFATCLANGTYDDEIMADLNEGASFGVNGTPGFFINGYFLSGAQPYSTF